MNVTEYIKAEWSPPWSIVKIERNGAGWKIDEKILQEL